MHVSSFIFILFGFTNDFFLQLDDLYGNHDNDDGHPLTSNQYQDEWLVFHVSFFFQFFFALLVILFYN
jgi:hypothetical protein